MSAVAVAGMAVSAWGSNQAQNASEDAQRRQEQAMREAMRGSEAQQRYNQQQMSPYIQAGREALTDYRALAGLGGDTEGAQRALEGSAGYQAGRIGGERSLAAMAGARGGMGSGKAMQASTKFGQDYATGQRSNRLSELAGIVNMGRSASGDAMSSGDRYADRMGQYQMGMGNIGAAGSLGRSSNRQSTISGLVGLGLQGYQNYQNQQNPWNNPNNREYNYGTGISENAWLNNNNIR